MFRLNCAVAVFGLATATTFSNVLASGSLRRPYRQEPSPLEDLEDLLVRMEALEKEIKTIPELEKKIINLENTISELQEHRKMEEECGFTFTPGGACQLVKPVEFMSELFVEGNTTLKGDFEVVQGKTILGGDVDMFSNEVFVTGNTTLTELTVGDKLSVYGDSIFGAALEATKDVKMDSGITTFGHSEFYDVVVDHDMEVKGTAHMDDQVLIDGPYGELRVEADVIIGDEYGRYDYDVIINSDTIFEGSQTFEGDVRVQGNLQVDQKGTFKQDLDVEGAQQVQGDAQFAQKTVFDGDMDVKGAARFRGSGSQKKVTMKELDVETLKYESCTDGVGAPC